MARALSTEKLQSSRVMNATITALKRNGCTVDEKKLMELAVEPSGNRTKRHKAETVAAEANAKARGLHILSDREIRDRKAAAQKSDLPE